MTQFDMAGYLNIFLDEVDEQLEILDTAVLELEREPTNSQTIQQIFRAAHTLKGSSAAMGFERMKELTHYLENVFENIRQEKVHVTRALIEIILESIDTIRELKEEILSSSDQQLSVESIIERLTLISCTVDTNTQVVSSEKDIPHTMMILDSFQLSVVTQSYDEGYQVFDVKFQIKDTCLMKSVRALIVNNALLEIGEIIAITPDTKEIENDSTFEGEVQLVFITKESKQSVEKLLQYASELASYSVLEVALDETKQMVDEHHSKADLNDKEKVLNLHLQPTNSTNNSAESPNNAKQKIPDLNPTKPKSKASSTVRVDVEKLEYLMNLVGELVIDQTRLVDVRSRFAEKNIHNEIEFEILDEVTNHLNRVVSELQEGMMKTRMMPIEQLFNRYPRVVRDTALKANKEINFVMEGKETDLDRTLIEEISDPIIHLLRNAVDHGIESVDDRIRSGKSKSGNILLSASHEDNHVVISIKDDGKGIDVEKVKKTSIQKGFLTVEQANHLTDKEAMELIFHSGMSTAEKVTDISGRGVGMDIVKSHIEKLNGVIEIDSTIGIGTTFKVKLPLTLAIIRSLLVKFADRTFAIPLTNVIEIVRLNKEDIQIIKGKEVGMIRGRILPLVRMNEMLKLPQPTTGANKKREFVVVVGIADKRIGLIADRTLGNQEIVIKSLGSYIGSPPFISGATIMGDGSVALILDVNAVVKEQGAQVIDEEITQNRNVDIEQQLVTFKAGTEEYGIEIQQAKDIISVTEITKVANSREDVLGIINLRGQMLPVYDLRKRLGLAEARYTRKTRIIVIEDKGRDVGFLVDEVTQVMKATNIEIEQMNVYKDRAHMDLIQGVTKVDDRVVFILALDQLLNDENVINE